MTWFRFPAVPAAVRWSVAEDNGAKILDLAVAAIDARGESAVRVNHIAEEAGVTPPVLYYHPPDRGRHHCHRACSGPMRVERRSP
jgi:AcrR family transcriptional regulator